jgi:hypothetical protein
LKPGRAAGGEYEQSKEAANFFVLSCDSVESERFLLKEAASYSISDTCGGEYMHSSLTCDVRTGVSPSHDKEGIETEMGSTASTDSTT